MGPSINTLIRNWLHAVATLRGCLIEMPVEIDLPPRPVKRGDYAEVYIGIVSAMEAVHDQHPLISEKTFGNLAQGIGQLALAYRTIQDLQEQEDEDGEDFLKDVISESIRKKESTLYYGVEATIDNANTILLLASEYILRDKGQRE